MMDDFLEIRDLLSGEWLYVERQVALKGETAVNQCDI